MLEALNRQVQLCSSGCNNMFLNVNITGRGIVKTLIPTDGNGKGQDTLAGNNGRWLIGSKRGEHNQKNGTVRIPVNGTKTFQLLMQDNGYLAKKNGKLNISVTWSGGEVSESTLTW